MIIHVVIERIGALCLGNRQSYERTFSVWNTIKIEVFNVWVCFFMIGYQASERLTYNI